MIRVPPFVEACAGMRRVSLIVCHSDRVSKPEITGIGDKGVPEYPEKAKQVPIALVRIHLYPIPISPSSAYKAVNLLICDGRSGMVNAGATLSDR